MTGEVRTLHFGSRRDGTRFGAPAFAAVGVTTVVTSANGPDPAGWLKSTMGPAIDDIRTMEPVTWWWLITRALRVSGGRERRGKISA